MRRAPGYHLPMKTLLLAWARNIKALFASRLAGGLLLLGVVAFGAHSVFAPARLPPFGGLGLEQLGLAQTLQIPPLPIDAETAQSVRESARDAVQSGLPYGQEFLARNPQIIPRINLGLAIMAAALLAASLAMRISGKPPDQRGDITITT